MNTRTEQAKERYQKAKTLVDGGRGIVEAVDQVGSSLGSWYKYRKEEKSKRTAAKKISAKPARRHKFVDLPVVAQETAPPQKQVAIIFGSVEQVSEILKGLR